MNDPYELARIRMVEQQLRQRGIENERVLEAMGTVPRHRFVPASRQHQAYQDGPLPIGSGQTISQPYMVAIMTEVLDPGPGAKVLEVGTGSGYQAAVLAELCDKLYTIERHPELAEAARRTLAGLGYQQVEVVVGDGTKGLPEQAPFDRIMVTAGGPQVPEALTEQLAPGGVLVIPVGPRVQQTLVRVTRKSDGELVEEKLLRCAFVPLIGDEGWSGD